VTSDAKDRMVMAALELLRQSGLTGAGVNQVVDASGAPKGSLYHYFPGGKDQLVVAALREADTLVGDGLRRVFDGDRPLGDKVRALFGATAQSMEQNDFTRGCPVAAVTVDLEPTTGELRQTCAGIFDAWRDIVADGLREVPKGQRREIADLLLAALEGAMILARARGTNDALVSTGDALATVLAARFPAPMRRRGGRG
jgi:TetR/AcrR family transcriptional repressor of lmrAB and yxaGH operons